MRQQSWENKDLIKCVKHTTITIVWNNSRILGSVAEVLMERKFNTAKAITETDAILTHLKNEAPNKKQFYTFNQPVCILKSKRILPDIKHSWDSMSFWAMEWPVTWSYFQPFMWYIILSLCSQLMTLAFIHLQLRALHNVTTVLIALLGKYYNWLANSNQMVMVAFFP